MVLNMKVNGLMTCNTDMVLKPGTMVVQDTKDNFSKVKSMEKEDLIGKMEVTMTVISLTVSFKGLESTTLLI